MRTKKTTAIVCVTLALLLCLPAVLAVWGFCLPAQYTETFMGELPYKAALLRDTPGPRIILVGGSGVAFGADSALIERELGGVSVVNFGMYAALGTTVMLDLSEAYIREGDIVILIPEQQSQTLSDWFDPAVMWQGLDGSFSLLGDLPRDKLERLLGAFPSFAGEKAACFLSGEPPLPQGVYARSSFNDRGDVVSALCGQNEMPGGYDANTPIRFDRGMVSEAFIDRVRDYAAAIREKGGQLWYGFCPMNAAAVEATEAEIDDFYAYLRESLDIPLAGNPHDFILDAGWFYDTNFHPNTDGKTVYTRALIRAIKAMLGDSSPTPISLPEMPAMADAEPLVGDDRDAGCFLLEQRDGAAAVVGLTEEGRERQSVVVPSTLDGLPVTEIAAGAFAGGLRLEEITIGPGIRAIADGVFAACPALERIVLRQTEPSACRVGQKLLDGSDADVYVPADALTAYRSDYFWSAYGARLQPLAP